MLLVNYEEPDLVVARGFPFERALTIAAADEERGALWAQEVGR